jgi:hypothetical protein
MARGERYERKALGSATLATKAVASAGPDRPALHYVQSLVNHPSSPQIRRVCWRGIDVKEVIQGRRHCLSRALGVAPSARIGLFAHEHEAPAIRRGTPRLWRRSRMYGPPQVGKLDRMRAAGSASMYPAFGWSVSSATMDLHQPVAPGAAPADRVGPCLLRSTKCMLGRCTASAIASAST